MNCTSTVSPGSATPAAHFEQLCIARCILSINSPSLGQLWMPISSLLDPGVGCMLQLTSPRLGIQGQQQISVEPPGWPGKSHKPGDRLAGRFPPSPQSMTCCSPASRFTCHSNAAYSGLHAPRLRFQRRGSCTRLQLGCDDRMYICSVLAWSIPVKDAHKCSLNQ
jgi:hypothetical protein